MKSSNSKKRAFSTRSGSAMERAQSFHSVNPVFIREMQRSYVERNIMVPFSHKQSNHMYSNTFLILMCCAVIFVYIMCYLFLI